MVKPLKAEETPFVCNTKFELFKRDILEIIEKKIQYCELIDCPYAASTVPQDLEYRAKRIIREALRKKGFNPDKVNFFIFKKVIDKNRNPHFYVSFNVKAWDELIG